MAIRKKISEATIFQTVRSSLINAVNSRDLKIGEKLPTEAELAAFFGASRPTINKVLRSLSQDGLLETRKRGGTIVLEPKGINISLMEISDHVTAIGKHYQFILEKYHKGRNGSGGVHWPGVIKETPLLVIECIHFSDNIPIQHEKRFINLDSAPEANSVDFSSVSAGKWIKNYIPFPTVTQELGAVGAGNSLSDLLRVRRATPCIGIRQLVKKNNEFISLAELTSPAGRFQIYSLYEP